MTNYVALETLNRIHSRKRHEMERAGIEYLYSVDDDFDALEGITRLETPDTPFDWPIVDLDRSARTGRPDR